MCKVVYASARPSCPSRLIVRSAFDKAHVRPIRVNAMLTLDRVKPELLSPQWLPHRCHIG
jgi:hypothetical protein